ncbi:MAG: universal stress protein [Spirochaetes bacterium]|nr:universal stress protein [Spirochaetota bacterium]
MKRYQNIIVLLNLDESDTLTLKYASLISNLTQSKKFFFVYLTESLGFPGSILKEYPEVELKAEKDAYKKLKKIVGREFRGCSSSELEYAVLSCSYSTDYEVVEGKTLHELLRMNIEKDADLVIFSYDQHNEYSLNLAKKIARKSSCSVFAIPGQGTGDYKDILVPVDFSDHSRDTVEVAGIFARTNGIKKIRTVNIYKVPQGFYKTGKSYEQFADIMKTHAAKNYDEFIAKADIPGIEVEEMYSLNDNIVEGIIEVIKDKGIDLVILGSRGRGTVASILLGSVPEKLIQETIIPILIVKKKDEGIGFLKAFLEI